MIDLSRDVKEISMQTAQRFGSYFLLRKIAAGGMAELYKAKKSGEKGFEKLLAIKMILPHLSANEEFLSMFIDEAKVAARLDHQNVVQIYDLGKIEDSYCIVMEYVRGKDLKAVLARGQRLGQPLGIERSCLVMSSVLAGLSYAHRKKDGGEDLGIVHRDISPPNVLISYEGEVKIVDFGIAKAATSSDTGVGILKGKVAYMSPEQAAGQPIDMRSDIFSAGAVFYEMLTGRKLFSGDTELNTLEKVKAAKVEPMPFRLNADIPSELEAIVLKALAREPKERFQSASEMEEALQAFMSGAGILAGSLPLSQYMRRLFRDEIDDELMEDEEWDRTVVSKTPPPALREAQGTWTSPNVTVMFVLIAVAASLLAWYLLRPAPTRYQIEVKQPIPAQTAAVPEAPKTQVEQDEKAATAAEMNPEQKPNTGSPGRKAGKKVIKIETDKTTSIISYGSHRPVKETAR